MRVTSVTPPVVPSRLLFACLRILSSDPALLPAFSSREWLEAVIPDFPWGVFRDRRLPAFEAGTRSGLAEVWQKVGSSSLAWSRFGFPGALWLLIVHPQAITSRMLPHRWVAPTDVQVFSFSQPVCSQVHMSDLSPHQLVAAETSAQLRACSW